MQYTLTHLVPELVAVLINICFSIPSGMSSLMILRSAPPPPPPNESMSP